MRDDYRWPWRLERRPRASVAMSLLSSPLAAVAMLLTGFIALSALGTDPFKAFQVFFIEPVSSLYGVGELLLKAIARMSGTSVPRASSRWVPSRAGEWASTAATRSAAPHWS
jgi:hypothetical protein